MHYFCSNYVYFESATYVQTVKVMSPSEYPVSSLEHRKRRAMNNGSLYVTIFSTQQHVYNPASCTRAGSVSVVTVSALCVSSLPAAFSQTPR